MGQISVTINGKHYRMACEDGEEPYLAGLAARLSASVDALRARFGEIGDQRLTVMAALTFADQAAEAVRRVAELERQLAESERMREAEAGREAENAGRAAREMVAAAERIEALAGRVGGVPALSRIAGG